MNEGDIVICNGCNNRYFTDGKQYTIIRCYTHTLLLLTNIGDINCVSKNDFILLSDYREFQLNKILKDEL